MVREVWANNLIASFTKITSYYYQAELTASIGMGFEMQNDLLVQYLRNGGVTYVNNSNNETTNFEAALTFNKKFFVITLRKIIQENIFLIQ